MDTPHVSSDLATLVGHYSQHTQEEPLLELLHNICMSSCLVKLAKYTQPTFLLCTTSIACCTVTARQYDDITTNVRLAQASDVIPVLAALQYAISSVAIAQIYRMAQEFGNDPQSWTAEQQGKFTTVAQCLDAETNMAASYVRSTLNTVNWIMENEALNVTLHPCDIYRHCGLVKSIQISMEAVGGFLKGRQKEFDHVLHTGLLRGEALLRVV